MTQADALRAKRRQVLAHLDALPTAIFLERFGNPLTETPQHPIRKLAEIGKIDRGISKHRPRNDPKLLGGPYPLIQTGDVAQARGYITEFHATYSELGLAQSRLWPAGTLCITIAANIAKTAILTFDACFPDSVVGFSADRPTTYFIRIWLDFLQQRLEATATQSAQKNINLKVLRELEVALPPQEQLAEFMGNVEQLRLVQLRAQRDLEAYNRLFESLQSRAFRREL